MTTIVDRAEKARLNKKFQDKSRAKNLLKKRELPKRGLSSSDYDDRSPSPPNHQSPTENPYFTGTPHRIPPNTGHFLDQISFNISRHMNHRRWSILMLSISAFILFSSYTAFNYLRGNVLLPSRSTIYRFLNKFDKFDVDSITSIEKVDSTIHQYKKTNDISNEIIIPAILAVDAVSLHPYVTIENKNEVKGLVSKRVLNSEEAQILNDVIENQESLIQKLRSETIKNAFVYYVQPIDPIYKCFTIYIEPYVNGNAGLKQLETLSKLKKILKDNNITILSYSSDGDPGYISYTEMTTKRWDGEMKPILTFSEDLHINDPLHIIKRGRYRLLSHNLVLLKKEEEEIKLEKMKQILNMPSIYFDNHIYTKMHDFLPIKLFSIENFDNLLYAELFKESAYFLPFTLLTEALSGENLTLDERIDFIEIMCFYCSYFKTMYEKTKRGEAACQTGSSKCILFDMNLIDDLISTGLVINSILNSCYGLVSLNRIGTNPLEHHFGLLRIRCKFQHNFDRFVHEEKKVELLDEIEKMTIDNIVSSRKKTFGEKVFFRWNCSL